MVAERNEENQLMYNKTQLNFCFSTCPVNIFVDGEGRGRECENQEEEKKKKDEEKKVEDNQKKMEGVYLFLHTGEGRCKAKRSGSPFGYYAVCVSGEEEKDWLTRFGPSLFSNKSNLDNRTT